MVKDLRPLLALILYLGPATVSHPPTLLTEAGLVSAQKDQYYQTYSLVNAPLKKTLAELVFITQTDLPGRVEEDAYRKKVLDTFESEAHGIWCYLAGDPANDAYNQALNTAIFTRQGIAEIAPILFLTSDPDDWGGQMEAVLAPRPPVWFLRNHFIGRKVSFDWRSALPAGFTVEQGTGGLRQVPCLRLPEDVEATLSKWQAITDPRFVDFGFVTPDRGGPQPVIASRAAVDFIATGAGTWASSSSRSTAAAALAPSPFRRPLTMQCWRCKL